MEVTPPLLSPAPSLLSPAPSLLSSNCQSDMIINFIQSAN